MLLTESSATETEPVEPNKADIAAHLYALFDPAFVQKYPDSWIEIAHCTPNGKLDQAQNYSVFELQKAIEFAEDRNVAGDNIYVGAALRHGKQPRSGRAERAHVLDASHAWAEYDAKGDDERIQALIKEHSLAPAVVVTTGTVPYPRRHLYFRLDGAVTPDQIKAANMALCYLLGSDKVHDSPRVMRLAGTINYPKAEKAGRWLCHGAGDLARQQGCAGISCGRPNQAGAGRNGE